MKKFFERIMYEGYTLEELAIIAGGGSSKGPTPAQPQVQPTPAVEEASVEMDEDSKKKKLGTSKSQLKVPLAPTVDTGLKV